MRNKANPDFQDRLKNAAEARQALLAKRRAAPGPDDPVMIEKRRQRAAVLKAREERQAERARAREAEAAAAAEAERLAAEEAARVAAEEEAREEALKAEKKAERDARYAARKLAKKKRRKG